MIGKLKKYKYIVKNISDVITNSSSKVFVMKPMDAEYYRSIGGNTNAHIWTTKITEDLLLNDARIECPELVYSILGIDEADVLKAFQDEYYYTPKENDIPSEKLWLCFLDSYKKEISEKLLGNYIVEIDDNFDGFLNLYKQATKDSIYTSYPNF